MRFHNSNTGKHQSTRIKVVKLRDGLFQGYVVRSAPLRYHVSSSWFKMKAKHEYFPSLINFIVWCRTSDRVVLAREKKWKCLWVDAMRRFVAFRNIIYVTNKFENNEEVRWTNRYIFWMIFFLFSSYPSNFFHQNYSPTWNEASSVFCWF